LNCNKEQLFKGGVAEKKVKNHCFGKLNINDGFKFFSIITEKVWKMVFENEWEPCI